MNGLSATRQFTSGLVESLNKREFKYGRIEARIRMPRGQGLWPAFWMLGKNFFNVGWPRCGEIDIMEHANIVNNYTAAAHTSAYNYTIGTGKVSAIYIDDYDTNFHIYGVDWDENYLKFYLDNAEAPFFVCSKQEMGSTEAEWPFDQNFWIKLNLAVGGPYGGNPAGGSYPYTMSIDWVRVYDKSL